MYVSHKTHTQHRFPSLPNYPSFSSTLLDQVYRSFEHSDGADMKFYPDTTAMKQSRSSGRCNRAVEVEEEDVGKAKLRRACLVEKWMDKKVAENQPTRKVHQHHDHDQDDSVLFFSSTSSSSDSSSGGFSSSDTESMYGARSQSSCFAPPRPKPVRTSVSARSDKTDNKHRARALFHQQREDKHKFHEEGLIGSKSRALKIYDNLKKAKQPISPGGRLTSFLNSLFTTGNTKKSKSTSTSTSSCSVGGCEDVNAERKSKSGQASTCSSASSFSRSCLSKTSPSLRNGVKRTVRFYPVSVIVDEDSRPCGHKCLYEEDDDAGLMPVSVPKAWKIGGSSNYKKNDEAMKVSVVEKSRRAEEAAREFLKEYHQNQKKSDLILRDFPIRTNVVEDDDEDDDDDDDDDDAASYSSSDLFELDHLAIMGNGRYSEELPVYETTHVSSNRAIASGLVM